MKVDKIYVLNLKRREDRLEQFFKNCPIKKSSIEVFYGIDSKKSEDKLKKLKKFEYLENIGEIACFLSHIKIWKKALKKKYNNILIFEDDALFSENFLSFFKSINFKYESILFLGGRFKKNFEMKDCIFVNDKIIKHDVCKKWKGKQQDRTTHAYIINLKTIKLLLNQFKKLEHVYIPIDKFIIKMLIKTNIDIYSTYPLICWSKFKGDSDIR